MCCLEFIVTELSPLCRHNPQVPLNSRRLCVPALGLGTATKYGFVWQNGPLQALACHYQNRSGEVPGDCLYHLFRQHGADSREHHRVGAVEPGNLHQFGSV